MKDFILPAKVSCTVEEYHAHPAVGSSSLRTLIEQSPAHYLHERLNPSEPTPAQRYGTAIHQAILEPDAFHKNAIVEPEFAGKGSVAAKLEWHLENHGRLILKSDQYDAIKGMLKSISMHKLAFKFVSLGASEASLFWKDHQSGIACKARPDFVREGHILVDIKTTEDASYRSFQKTIANYGYHVQAALYLDGATEVHGTKFDEFIIMAIEKSAPYAINCFLLDEDMIMEGRSLYYKALKMLAECHKTEKFPAYPEVLSPITLLSWAYQIGTPNG